MAVQSETSRISYVGNNSTSAAYTVPFVFLEASHLAATQKTASGVETSVTLSNHTGAGEPSGGTVTTTVAVPNTSTLTIYRVVPLTQSTSYAEGGDFPAASHERAIDKLTQIDQQHKRALDRSIRVTEAMGSVAPFSNKPNTILGMDGASSPKAMTSTEVKTFLALSGVTLDVAAGMKTAADAGERNLAVPDFSGQLLTQRDTGVVYVSTGTSAGMWAAIATLILAPGSTTARTAAARFGDMLNVKDFGATGNGETDDTSAIQAAIDAVANTSQGGTIFIPPGSYLVTGPLYVRKSNGAAVGTGVVIQGGGQSNTRLIQTSNTDNTLEFWSMSFSGITDIEITHATPNTASAGYALVIRDSDVLPTGGLHAFAERIYINQTYNGILIQSCVEARIKGSSLRGLRGTNGILFKGTSAKPAFGCYLEDITSEANTFVNNTSLDHYVYDSYAYSLQMVKCTGLNGRYGLWMKNTGGTDSSIPRWCFVSGLELDFNTANAALIDGGEGFYAENSWFSSSQGNSGLYYGSTFRGESCLSNCRAVWNKYHGIVIAGGREILISNSVIGDNGFGDPTTVTISNASPAVVTYASAHNLLNGDPIRFNTTGTLPSPLVDTPPPKVGNGQVYYVRNKTATTFELSSTPSGSVINTTTAGSGVHVIRPIAYNGVAVVGGVNQFSITNCSLGDAVALEGSQQRYGVSISAGSSADFVIANNIIKNNVSGAIRNSSTGTGIISNNVGHNPVGSSSVSVTASPMTYTAGSTPTTLSINGGTVSSVVVDSVTLFTATGCSVRLGANKSAIITYSSAPTIIATID
jgi:hypothetical protein